MAPGDSNEHYANRLKLLVIQNDGFQSFKFTIRIPKLLVGFPEQLSDFFKGDIGRHGWLLRM